MRPSAYGPFPYSPIIERPKLIWPDGARIALWIIPNIEFFSLMDKVPAAAGGSGAPVPDVPAWAVRDYGNRVGVFRMMKVLDRHGIRATVALNSDLCAQHPQIMREGMARGWEWMGHCQTNTMRLNAVAPEQEAGLIKTAMDEIERATGTRPKGWLGSGLQETWATLDLLADNGCTYVADWVNDEQPYRMTLEGGRSLVSVPYSYELNDKPVFEKRGHTAAQFCEMICRQFDTLYAEAGEDGSGRVMAIALHPYLTGVPHRISALDEALAYVCRHPGVWRTTGAEIAEHFASGKAGHSA